MNREHMLWLAPVSTRANMFDRRVVLLEKPESLGRLDLTKAKELNVFKSSADLLECDYIHLTLWQDPCNIPVDRNMYPFYYELLDQLPENVFYKAFQLIDIPSLRMSVKKIHTNFVLRGKKIPFEVRLWV